MLRVIAGIFVILHGLVHLWYLSLSQKLVNYRPEMVWSGESWLFTPQVGESTTRILASTSFALSAIIFAASGGGLIIQSGWWHSLLMVSSLFSSAVILLFWDGKATMLVEKGVLGLLINLVILVALLVNIV